MEEMGLSSRYRLICSKIPKQVTLVAVSKGQPSFAIRALYGLGHRDFGENYVQELLSKAEELVDLPDIRWHFIGHLQRNKARKVLPHLFSIHTIDSVRLIQQIDKDAESINLEKKIQAFVQVNIDLEKTKSGTGLEDITEVVQKLQKSKSLEFVGLMCIPDAQRQDLGAPFYRLSEMAKKVGSGENVKLSMGMSDDYELAMNAGATHVRLGTILFGPRKGTE